jgi:hypothetical protein
MRFWLRLWHHPGRHRRPSYRGGRHHRGNRSRPH